MKNLNSFRYLRQALEYEIDRQIDLVELGGRVDQETRLWDQATSRTITMRSKEEAHDYRYFPEPDLPPVDVDAARVERSPAALPELPAARRDRFIAEFGLSAYDATELTRDARDRRLVCGRRRRRCAGQGGGQLADGRDGARPERRRADLPTAPSAPRDLPG